MSLSRSFVAPSSTRTKRLGSKTLLDNDGDLTSPIIKIGVSNVEEGYDQTPISDSYSNS
jgi:hypothetical protein